MRFNEFNTNLPGLGDILEIELDDELVEARIVGITDGHIICETGNKDAHALLEARWGRSTYYNPLDQERREQEYMDWEKRDFKRREHEAEWEMEKRYADQRAAQDAGTWYIRIDGKVYKQKGLPKSFNGKKAANAYALAILRNRPELQGKIFLTTKPEDSAGMQEDADKKMTHDDYQARGKAIQDLQMDPSSSKDPMMRQKLMRSKAELDKLAKTSGITQEGYDDEDDNNPVMNAVIRRIMMTRPDLLKHGPQRVLDAVRDVADFVGDVEEIGTSDVSGWVKQVEQNLMSMNEAEYQGRNVALGKPMQGDVKKFKVYVKNPSGNVVKVNFGDPNMRIKKSNPARRKSFRARHNCDNPGPRHKARYWSCRKW